MKLPKNMYHSPPFESRKCKPWGVCQQRGALMFEGLNSLNLAQGQKKENYCFDVVILTRFKATGCRRFVNCEVWKDPEYA